MRSDPITAFALCLPHIAAGLAEGDAPKICMNGPFIKLRETMNFVNFAGRRVDRCAETAAIVAVCRSISRVTAQT
jgi:hypothetical protein